MWNGDRDLEAGGPSREDSGSESLSEPGTAPGPLGCSTGDLRNPRPPRHPSAGLSVVTQRRNGAAPWTGRGREPCGTCGNSAEPSLTTGPLRDFRRVSSVTRASVGEGGSPPPAADRWGSRAPRDSVCHVSPPPRLLWSRQLGWLPVRSGSPSAA